MDLRDIFSGAFHIAANPHYYDYIHFIDRAEDGALEMVDGGGQALRRQINGRVEVIDATASVAELLFCDLFDVDPYGRKPDKKKLEDLRVRVEVEAGPFALRQGVVWHVKEGEEPWLLYQHRLVFSEDPISIGQQQITSIPPEVYDHPEVLPMFENMVQGALARRRYYVSKSSINLLQREIMGMGLPEEAFAK